MRDARLPGTTSSIEHHGVPAIISYHLSRLRAVLIVILVIAATAVVIAPADARGRKVSLGVSITASNASVSALQSHIDDFTSDVGGNKPAIWTLWSQWGARGGDYPDCDPNDLSKPCQHYPACADSMPCAFPMAKAQLVHDEGMTPLIWWEPISSKRSGDADARDTEIKLGCPYSRHARIASGELDPYIKAWADDAKRFGHTVILRYTHEITGRYFPWTKAHCGNTSKSYKKGWRHVVKVFRAEGATNVKFLWTVAKQTCRGGCNPYAAFYPGDRFVSYVGFSSFNWGSWKGKWVPMVNGVKDILHYIRKFTSKPAIVAELGTNKEGGPTGTPSVDKPNWITTGYPGVFRKQPSIKAIIYLDEDLRPVGHPDWSLNMPNNPGAYGAYAAIASEKRFKGHIN